METDTAFVRANGVVMLNTVPHVGLHLTFVVDPGDTEREDAVGNAKTFNQVVTVELGVFVVSFLNGTQHFRNGLMVFGFVGKASFQIA